MKLIHRLACTLVLAVAATGALAGASKAEATAQVNAAVAHVKKVGVEQAVKDFNTDPQWKVNGMNVIANDAKGMVLASSLNDKLRGKSTLEIKDPSGKFFIKEATDLAATKGEGWVEYQFVNPETKKIEDRTMFVKQTPGGVGFIAVAISKQ